MTDSQIKLNSLIEARQRILSEYSESKNTNEPVIGNYDADSNLLNDGSTNRLTSPFYGRVQAPELKNQDGSLNPTGIRARIQADNFAMGITDAPNISNEQANYFASNPEEYSRYTNAMNPSIKDAVDNQTYLPSNTGSTDKYGRPLTYGLNNTSPIDQAQHLVNTSNAYGTITDPTKQISFDTLGIKGLSPKELDRKASADAIDSLQSGLVNLGGNIVNGAGKYLTSLGEANIENGNKDNPFRAKVDEPLIDMSGLAIKAGKYLDKTGADWAKNADEITGAWNSSSEMLGDVWSEVKKGNVGNAVSNVSLEGVVDLVARSLPEAVATLNPYTFALVATANSNRILEDFKEERKLAGLSEDISSARAFGAILGGLAMTYADRLGIQTLTGKGALSNEIKSLVSTLGSNLPKGVIADASKNILKYGTKLGLATGTEAGTEVVQEGIQIAGAEIGADLGKSIYREENIDKLGMGAIGGFLGGGAVKVAHDAATAPFNATQPLVKKALENRLDNVKKEQELKAKVAEAEKPYTDVFTNIKSKGDEDLVTNINELIYLSQDLELDGNTKLKAEVDSYRDNLVTKLSSTVNDENSFKFGSSEEAQVVMEELVNHNNKTNKGVISPALESNLNTIAQKYGLENELAKIKDRGQVEEQATVSDIGYLSYGNRLKKLVSEPETNKNQINKYIKKLENFKATQETKLSKLNNILEQAAVQFDNTESNMLKFPEYQVRVNPLTGKGKPLEINRQDYMNYKEGNITGYWKILEDTKRNIEGIKSQLSIPGVEESIATAREDVEVVAPMTSSANINKFRLAQQTRFKNNKVNKLIATGSRTGKEYRDVNEDISNTGSYTADDTVGVVFDKRVENLVYFKKKKSAVSKDNDVFLAGQEILKAIKAKATIITSIKSARITKVKTADGKSVTKDRLAKFMLDAGYKETVLGNGIWKPADQVESKEPDIDIEPEINTNTNKDKDKDKDKSKESTKERVTNKQESEVEVKEEVVEEVSNEYVEEIKDISNEVKLVKSKLTNNTNLSEKVITDLQVRLKELEDSLQEKLNNQETDLILANASSNGIEITPSKNLNIKESYDTSLNYIAQSKAKTILGSLHITAFSPKIQKFTSSLKSNLNTLIPKLDNTVTKFGNKTQEYFNLMTSPSRGLIFNKEGEINSNVALAMGTSIEDLIKNSGSLLKLKNRDEVMRMLDKIYLSKEEYDFFKDKGMFLKVVADDLASSIMKNLGMSFNKNIPEELKAKFKADLGNTTVSLAEAMGYISVTQVSLQELATKLGKENEYGIYRDDVDSLNTTVSFVTLGKTEPEMFDTLDESLNLESDYARLPSSTPIKNSKYNEQVRNNPFNTLTKKVKDILQKQRDTKYITRDKSIEWLKDNRDVALTWLGYKTVEEISKLSKVDQETAEAKNESIVRSLDALRDNNLESMYFDFFYTKNNRYILDSTTINPQTDKQLHRWLVVPESHKNTYSKSNPDDKSLLSVAVAQAMGMGIDKSLTPKIIKYGSSLLDLDAKHIKLLKDGLLEGNLDAFIKATGIEVEVEHLGHFLEAIDVIEQWNQAKEDGEIETTISAEFDGLTNGFAIRLMQMPIIKDVYNWLQKVGVFTKEDNPQSMNNILGDKSSRFLDSYQTLADNIKKLDTKTVLKTITKKNESNKITSTQVSAVLEVLPIKDIEGAITKDLRNLFKNPFMVFNYASSINSIKKNMGYVLRDKLISEMVEGKHKELANALGIKVSILQTKYPEDIKLANDVTLDQTIRDIVEASYGEQVGNILTEYFQEYLEANETINNSFRGMFLVFQDAYQKSIANIPEGQSKALTEEQKINKVIELLDLFPGIKGVLSKDIREGIAIYETKAKSPKDLLLGKAQSVFKDKTGKKYTKAVQGLLKELDSPVNAGAVIPIHSLDGSIMTELMLSLDGIVGIHDAIIPNLKDSTNAIKEYNKQFYELNKKYSIISSLLDQMNKTKEYMDKHNIDPVVNASVPKQAVKLSEVYEELKELNEKNNKAREELYSKDLSIGQMVGINQESLFVSGSKDKSTENNINNQQKDDTHDGDKFVVQDNITELKDNQIFVFGANAEGIHGKGSALQARKFGTANGEAVNSLSTNGKTWGIVTKTSPRGSKVSKNELTANINKLLKYASMPENANKEFLFTAIGTGLAGFTNEEVLEAIGDVTKYKNIKFPSKWRSISINSVKQYEDQIGDNEGNTEVNKAEIEKQYNLFSSNGDFIYNAADIKMSDKGLGDLITKGSTPIEILEYLSKHEEPFVASQAKYLLENTLLFRGKDKIFNTRVFATPQPNYINDGALASYVAKQDTIYYRSVENMQHPLVFLHEYTHALSSHGIELMETAIKNNTEPNNQKVNMYKQFLKDIDTVMEYKDRFEDIYAFKDRHEILAEFMANPIFRARLSELLVNKDKTIMQRLYNAVKELFGFKRERLFDLMNRSVDDIFRVNYEAFQTVPSLMEDINLLLTKPEGYTILNKILNKMRECN